MSSLKIISQEKLFYPYVCNVGTNVGWLLLFDLGKRPGMGPGINNLPAK
jgi:hypothetical protein